MQKLRRLAHNGKRSEAAAFLEETLRDNPAHVRAREELARYLTNRPFSFEESEHEELQKLLSDFLVSPQSLNSMSKTSLRRQRKRVQHLQQAVEHLLTSTEKNTLQQLRKAIAREEQRRRKPLSTAVVAAASGVSLLLLTAGTGFFLWQRSETAAESLEAAAGRQVPRNQALNLLQIHDTGLNRTLNRRVSAAADKLRANLAARQQRGRELDIILKRIEQGEQTVVGQGVRRRAEIERRLRELGADATPLRTRWAELCRREQGALDQQRLSLAEELMAPLPPGEQLCGNPDEDIKKLNARRKILQQRQSIFDDAGAALGLPATLIEPVIRELSLQEPLLREITRLRNQLQLLPTAHDYDQYRRQLEDIEVEHYLHGVDLMEIRRMIPKVSSLRGMMQKYGQNVPAGLLQAAQKSLMEGGPSFSPEFPATKEQLHLLDELLTNSALRTRLIELTGENNQTAYTEEAPVIRNSRVYFKRSTLDPQHDAARSNKEEWLNPQAVWQRPLDARALHRKLRLDNRSGFASTANIPLLITTVMQMDGNDAPVLARAYVLDHLLRINQLSTHAMLSGMRYAPEMREAAESFTQLRDTCGVTLDGNCWLQVSAAHSEAEKQFARWFSRHRKLNFAEELKRNLGALLRIVPRFCGYINEQGVPVLFEPPREGQLIWYISGSAITTTPWGAELQSPRRLSPVFSMEKTS